jgi:hypothetical protein
MAESTGQIQVFYQNGEIRLTNLHPVFFKHSDPSVADRANDIAYMNNSKPWKIYVTIDGVLSYKKIVLENDPARLIDTEPVEEEIIVAPLPKKRSLPNTKNRAA